MSIIDGLILTPRAQEHEDGYRLDRAEIDGDTDAINWLLRYRTDDDERVWDDFGPAGPPHRREVAAALRRVRDRFTGEWKARGGQEA